MEVIKHDRQDGQCPQPIDVRAVGRRFVLGARRGTGALFDCDIESQCSLLMDFGVVEMPLVNEISRCAGLAPGR
jgi:hypothetical protein